MEEQYVLMLSSASLRYTASQVYHFNWSIRYTLNSFVLNSIQDRPFLDCPQIKGAGQKGLLYLKSVTDFPQWWNLAQLYLNERISKNYINRETQEVQLTTTFFHMKWANFAILKNTCNFNKFHLILLSLSRLF